MVEQKPTFKEVAPELTKFIGDFPLVAHNAQYDLSFIIYHLLANDLNLPKGKVYCSYHFTKSVMKKLKYILL